MKAKELKALLEKVDDDFDINIIIYKKIPESELKDTIYPYPFMEEEINLEFCDIGYSSKLIKFTAEIKNI